MTLEQIIAGIDVGSTKVCTLIGHTTENGAPLHIVGMGVVPAQGVRKGVVTDIEMAARCIGESIQRAQRMAGHAISEVYLSVGGSHIASQTGRGAVSIGPGDRWV
ncbi:MAG: cell division protein FtsA, partial [Chloroflexi bacterium]|nr:cell division protein FtsA [Chloroflexota bacterium]